MLKMDTILLKVWNDAHNTVNPRMDGKIFE